MSQRRSVPDRLVKLDLRAVPVADREKVAAVMDHLQQAGERVILAARQWCEISEATRDDLIARAGGYAEFFRRLQRIGEGTLHPDLYAVPGKAASTLGRLPMDEQEKYLSNPIPVARQTTSGRWETIHLKVTALNEQQRLQVFGKRDDGYYFVRTREQQKAWWQKRRKIIESSEASETPITRANRYEIRAGKVYVDPKAMTAGLTKRDVMQMLKDFGV